MIGELLTAAAAKPADPAPGVNFSLDWIVNLIKEFVVIAVLVGGAILLWRAKGGNHHDAMKHSGLMILGLMWVAIAVTAGGGIAIGVYFATQLGLL